MSTFTEKNTGRIILTENDRVLSITRVQVKEIYRWSSSVKEKNPRAREEGEAIIGLFKRSISPMNPKPVDVIIKVDEIETLIWWQKISDALPSDLTKEVLKLLTDTRDRVKKEEPKEEKTTPTGDKS